LRPCDETFHKRQLRGVVFAAVRNVDRRDHLIAVLHLHDPRFHVERRMAEDGIDGEQVFANMERYAGVTLPAVPVHVVIVELALRWDLRGFSLQFLQADDVRAVALQPFTELCRPRTNAVNVPGSDFHAEYSNGEEGPKDL